MSNIDKKLARYSDKQIERASELIVEQLLDEYIDIDADLEHLQFLLICKAWDEFQNKNQGADQ